MKLCDLKNNHPKLLFLFSGSIVQPNLPRPVQRNDSSEKVAAHVKNLKRQVDTLRNQLNNTTTERKFKLKKW